MSCLICWLLHWKRVSVRFLILSLSNCIIAIEEDVIILFVLSLITNCLIFAIQKRYKTVKQIFKVRKNCKWNNKQQYKPRTNSIHPDHVLPTDIHRYILGTALHSQRVSAKYLARFRSMVGCHLLHSIVQCFGWQTEECLDMFPALYNSLAEFKQLC